MKDIQVYTALDAKVKPAERLDILVLSTKRICRPSMTWSF